MDKEKIDFRYELSLSEDENELDAAKFYFQYLIDNILGENYTNEAMNESAWYCLATREILSHYRSIEVELFHMGHNFSSYKEDHCPNWMVALFAVIGLISGVVLGVC